MRVRVLFRSALEVELKDAEEARQATQREAADALSQQQKAHELKLKADGASKAQLLEAKEAAVAARRAAEQQQRAADKAAKVSADVRRRGEADRAATRQAAKQRSAEAAAAREKVAEAKAKEAAAALAAAEAAEKGTVV
jgi:colicin import membrane protein